MVFCLYWQELSLSMKRRAIYRQLVRRYMENKASDKEREVFFHLLREGKLDEYLDAEMKTDARLLLSEEGSDGVKRIPLHRRYMAAAAMIGLILLGGGFWWIRESRPYPVVTAENYYKNDVAPGGNRAILTLADGSTITLDSAGKGNLVKQGNAQVTKVDAGKLTYKAVGNNAPAVYNMVSTPAGGRYQVTLEDGTRVWLNALSSLRFPTAFNGTYRSVELTGEGYFEVSGNKNKPFRVSVNGIEVEVLGTQFNVNAYSDESSVKTTLLEGAVKLRKGGSDILLKPGEQGQTTDKEGFVLVRNANVGEAVAWKNGFFSFDDANIQTVMRQIARWYGIQVRYEGSPTRALFWGKMQQDLNLIQMLTGLGKSNVHFRLEGTTLTVLP
jgi:ferric-dicitrate binding protein FerR (iron transport regulator)